MMAVVIAVGAAAVGDAEGIVGAISVKAEFLLVLWEGDSPTPIKNTVNNPIVVKNSLIFLYLIASTKLNIANGSTNIAITGSSPAVINSKLNK